ncbi:ABC transporter permease [Acuticoccus sediminis]|uniref:ABC transporter permease n=1 Tax=Acuticoccus sediminis TaxID=2184697 RepID=UPI001CFD6C13|nr:ABC transporter permease [Acuticoccus sediminis]
MSSNPAPSTFATSSSAAATPPREVRRRRRLAPLLEEAGIPVLAIGGLVAVWQLCVMVFEIPAFLLPSPARILRDSVAEADTLGWHTLATLKTVFLGFLASVVISLPLAVLITSSKRMANTIYPILVLTQSIPKVALAPILVILLGTNELPRIVVTFLVAFFPLVIAVATGLSSVPDDLVELGRSYRGSRWQMLTRIRLPYAVPMIFSGLKVAVTLSVVGAVVAEFVNADAGLGYFIISSTAFFETGLAYAALIILSLMGIVLFQIVVVAERVLFPWSPANTDPVSR